MSEYEFEEKIPQPKAPMSKFEQLHENILRVNAKALDLKIITLKNTHRLIGGINHDEPLNDIPQPSKNNVLDDLLDVLENIETYIDDSLNANQKLSSEIGEL